MKNRKLLVFLVVGLLIAEIVFQFVFMQGQRTRHHKLSEKMNLVQSRLDGKKNGLEGEDQLRELYEKRQQRVAGLADYLESRERFEEIVSSNEQVISFEPRECIEDEAGYNKVRYQVVMKLRYLDLAVFFKRFEVEGFKLFVVRMNVVKDSSMVARQVRNRPFKKLLTANMLVEFYVKEET